MHFKTLTSPPPPCHGQVLWDLTTNISEAFFFPSKFFFSFFFLEAFFIPVLPAGAAVDASPLYQSQRCHLVETGTKSSWSSCQGEERQPRIPPLQRPALAGSAPAAKQRVRPRDLQNAYDRFFGDQTLQMGLYYLKFKAPVGGKTTKGCKKVKKASGLDLLRCCG